MATDVGALIQGAASTALSPWCDPEDDRVRDAMADQVRDAVLSALADDGLLVVQTGCVHDFDPECARCNTLRFFRVDCTCRAGEGCDEEGDPGCAYCRSLDQEWPCPAEVVPCPDHDEVDGPHHNVECCYYAEVLDA